MAVSLAGLLSKAMSALGKEQEVIATLHADVRAAVDRMQEKDPGLKGALDNAYAYVVFPSVGKASAVIGGAFGKGEVVKDGKLIGYAGIVQVTLGVQLGGDTFTQIIAFESKEALDWFKQGKLTFAANASAVLVKAGAAATARYEKGVAVFVSSEGGMLLELAIGGQKFIYKPAVLGRGKPAGESEKSSRQPGRQTAKKRGGARKTNPSKRPRSRAAAAK